MMISFIKDFIVNIKFLVPKRKEKENGRDSNLEQNNFVIINILKLSFKRFSGFLESLSQASWVNLGLFTSLRATPTTLS